MDKANTKYPLAILWRGHKNYLKFRVLQIGKFNLLFEKIQTLKCRRTENSKEKDDEIYSLTPLISDILVKAKYLKQINDQIHKYKYYVICLNNNIISLFLDNVTGKF